MGNTEISEEELNKALKNIGQINGEGAKFVDLDDTIKFNCKRCGKCCSGRDDIILNPFDIYRIAKHLNTNAFNVIEEYCTVHCGTNSCIPIVTLKEDERGLCPFLKFSINEAKFGCSINDFKPGACVMHPIGVVRGFNNDDKTQKSKRFIHVPSCDVHGTDVEIKVRDFIKPYLDYEECHEAGSVLQFETLKYVNTTKLIKAFIEQDENAINEQFTEKEKETYEKLNFSGLINGAIYKTYMGTTLKSTFDFDTDKGFLEQIDTVKENIRQNSIKMIATLSMLGFNIVNKDTTYIDSDFLHDLKETREELEKSFEDFCDSKGLELEQEVKDDKH